MKLKFYAVLLLRRTRAGKKQGSEANASEPLFFSDMAVIRRKVLEIAFYVAHTPSFLAPVREKTVPVLKKMGEEREKVEVGE